MQARVKRSNRGMISLRLSWADNKDQLMNPETLKIKMKAWRRRKRVKKKRQARNLRRR